MSYASVAAQNAPPPSEQPQPNPAFREGAGTTSNGNGEVNPIAPDVDSSKVNVVPSGSDLDHLKTFSAEQAEDAANFAKKEKARLAKEAKEVEKAAEKKAKKAEKKVSRAAQKTSQDFQSAWVTFSSEPRYWGSALAAVNAALLGGLGYFAYTQRENARAWDRRLVSAVSVGVLAALGGQGYLATETARKQTGKK